jgi:dTDP-4-amino-4,6-dideoxygalactose transaminase
VLTVLWPHEPVFPEGTGLAVNHASLRKAHAEASARLVVARPRLPLAESILPYLQRIDDARWYSNFGPLLTELEGRLADRFPAGTRVVTVANGTQALTLALSAMGLPPGGYVAMPAWTFVATAHAVIQAGLVPWFVDVDEESWSLDPAVVAARLATAPHPVVAAVPVSPFGRPLDLAAWRSFRETTGLPVLVDAAAGFDTAQDARLPLVVSLHATKVAGAGEGGFLATEDAALADRVRALSTFGFRGSRDSLIPATNAKLSEYTAAVGLASLDSWPADRLRFMRAAQMLRIGLTSLPEIQFQPGWGSEWITSVCSVTLPEGSADAIEKSLSDQGVDTRRWWGLGCHTSPAFAALPRESLAVTDRLGGRVIGLPFSIDLSSAEIGRIAAALRQALAAL